MEEEPFQNLVNLCNNILEYDPQQSHASTLGGIGYSNTYSYSKALEYFRKAYANTPDKDYTNENLGIIYNELGYIYKPAAYFTYYYEKNPLMPLSLLDLLYVMS